MPAFRILAASDDISLVKEEVSKWFGQPIDLIYEDENIWRVWLHDEVNLAEYFNFFVVRDGTMFSVEAYYI